MQVLKASVICFAGGILFSENSRCHFAVRTELDRIKAVSSNSLDFYLLTKKIWLEYNSAQCTGKFSFSSDTSHENSVVLN